MMISSRTNATTYLPSSLTHYTTIVWRHTAAQRGQSGESQGSHHALGQGRSRDYQRTEQRKSHRAISIHSVLCESHATDEHPPSKNMGKGKGDAT
jgi:hypothetical protein